MSTAESTFGEPGEGAVESLGAIYIPGPTGATGPVGPAGPPGPGDALTTSPLSQFAPTTSAQLAGVISDETGSGSLVFNIAPVLNLPTFTNGAINFNAPRGFLINGKLDVTVNAGSLTFATKTLSGGNPSASDPIFVRIGDTVRAITSPLTKTLASGNNFFGLGSSRFATIEQDLFAYLMWDGTSIRILCSRIPYAQLQTDFDTSGSPWLNEKGYDGSGSGVGANTVENIGRFAATLSAGAGYTWSIPTFTSANLIQRPIYETRLRSFVSTTSANGSMTWTSVTQNHQYKLIGEKMLLKLDAKGTTGGTANIQLICSAPFTTGTTLTSTAIGWNQGNNVVTQIEWSGANLNLYNCPSNGVANWGLGASTGYQGNCVVEFPII